MNFSQSDLTAIQSPLVRFTGDTFNSEGVISLPMTLGEEPCKVTILVSFLIIKMPPTYNVILGRASQATPKAVVFIPHLKMKFPTPGGVRVARGDQFAEITKAYASFWIVGYFISCSPRTLLT
ncbi:hypothetical protein CFOL_v3_09373 [Cephalotus follicularis]|uniref:Uncharacterized protein n=1 Tax=Cephalotus follicularis TaxID=3775 RepID=A0A1Q3BD79_CEPFO|nr:hypothetical protein CFOL_v3_09373 [Cephalotus follicularis]